MAIENLDQREKEERKGGAALPSWMSGAANVGSRSGGVGGLSGGSGSFLAKFSAFMTSKGAIVATVLGGMAVGGVISYNELSKSSYKEKPSSVVFKGGSGSGSGPVMGSSSRGPSALDMASQANKGALGEAQGAGAAASAESADAAGDSKDAAGPGEIGGAAAPGSGDANAQAQQMAEALMKDQGSAAAGKDAALARKFGNMSSGLGGGNRQLAGGAGLSGGIGGSFNQKKLDNSTLRQMAAGARKAQTTQAKRAVGNQGSKLSGATSRRLDNMNRAMGGAKKDGVESQSAIHGQQWDGAGVGGQAIAGAGAGQPGGGFSSEEGGGVGNPVNEPSVTPGTPPGETPQAPSTGPSENVTPWQSMVDMAQMLMLLASVLLLVATIMGSFKAAPILGQAWYTIAKAIAYIALALSAVVAVIGIAIMTQGQMLQGAMFTVAGGLLAYLSYVAAENIDKRSAAAQAAAKDAVAPQASEAKGLLGEKALDNSVKAGGEVATKGVSAAAPPPATPAP